MDDNGRVLALCAHPDDVEFGCAGTLALLKRKGYSITIAVACRGDMGSATMGPDETATVRAEEAQNAAAMLGADYVNLGFSDVRLDYVAANRAPFVDLLRKVNPFIVITHPPVDYMTDHMITSKHVLDATFCASIPNFKTGNIQWDDKPASGIPHLYYQDAIESIDHFGNPWPVAFYVDISEVIETKAEMLKAHDSQRSWLQHQHGMDQYIETMYEWGRCRGHEAGVEYAEAFRQHRGHPYPQDNVLAKIIGVIEP